MGVRAVALGNSGATGTSATCAITVPAGAQIGDPLVVIVGVTIGSTQTISGPSGWTATTVQTNNLNQIQTQIFERTCASGDAGSVFTWTSTAAGRFLGLMLDLSGDTDVGMVVSAASVATSASTTVTSPTITTTAANSEVIVLSAMRSGTTTPGTLSTVAGWTSDGSVVSASATAPELTLQALHLTTPGAAGSYGGQAFTASQSVSSTTYTIALAPASTGFSGGLAVTGEGSLGLTGPAQGPGRICVLGDSLTYMGGSGSGWISSSLIADGWNSSNIAVDGVTGRNIYGGAVLPTSEQQIDSWRAAGIDANTWIVALGSNNDGASAATLSTYIHNLLAKIGPGRKVYWIDIGYYTQSENTWSYNAGAALGSRYTATGPSAVNATLRNIAEVGTNPATEATLIVCDWNGYAPLRAVADPTTIWLMTDTSSPTGHPRHMVNAGYTGYRVPFYTAAVHNEVTPRSGSLAVTGAGTTSFGASVHAQSGVFPGAGAGTLSLGGKPGGKATLAVAGAGALALGASVHAQSGVFPGAGAGTLTFATTSGVGTVAVTGVGSLVFGSITITTKGTLAATGVGTLLLVGKLLARGTLTLTGSGTLAFTGRAITRHSWWDGTKWITIAPQVWGGPVLGWLTIPVTITAVGSFA